MAITEEALRLESLPAGKWGDGLRRAREARGLTLAEVERLTAGEIAASSLAETERRAEEPRRRSIRQRAAAAMVLYGFAPSEIGLSIEEVGLVDVARLRRLLDEYAPRDSNPEPSDSRHWRRHVLLSEDTAEEAA